MIKPQLDEACIAIPRVINSFLLIRKLILHVADSLTSLADSSSALVFQQLKLHFKFLYADSVRPGAANSFFNTLL